MDRNNNQLHARMATHLTDKARQLEEGDVIRHRGTLPDCLEYAIKAAYPEECSEDWTGYKDAPSKKKKHSDVDTDYY